MPKQNISAQEYSACELVSVDKAGQFVRWRFRREVLDLRAQNISPRTGLSAVPTATPEFERIIMMSVRAHVRVRTAPPTVLARRVVWQRPMLQKARASGVVRASGTHTYDFIMFVFQLVKGGGVWLGCLPVGGRYQPGHVRRRFSTEHQAFMCQRHNQERLMNMVQICM